MAQIGLKALLPDPLPLLHPGQSRSHPGMLIDLPCYDSMFSVARCCKSKEKLQEMHSQQALPQVVVALNATLSRLLFITTATAAAGW